MRLEILDDNFWHEIHHRNLHVEVIIIFRLNKLWDSAEYHNELIAQGDFSPGNIELSNTHSYNKTIPVLRGQL